MGVSRDIQGNGGMNVIKIHYIKRRLRKRWQFIKARAPTHSLFLPLVKGLLLFTSEASCPVLTADRDERVDSPIP